VLSRRFDGEEVVLKAFLEKKKLRNAAKRCERNSKRTGGGSQNTTGWEAVKAGGWEGGEGWVIVRSVGP